MSRTWWTSCLTATFKWVFIQIKHILLHPFHLHTHTHTHKKLCHCKSNCHIWTHINAHPKYICLRANMYVQAVLLHFAVGPSHMSQTLIYILLQIILSLSLSLSHTHTHTHTGADFNKILSINYDRKVKRATIQQYKEFMNKGNYDVSCKFPSFLVSNKNATGNKSM